MCMCVGGGGGGIMKSGNSTGFLNAQGLQIHSKLKYNKSEVELSSAQLHEGNFHTALVLNCLSMAVMTYNTNESC